MLDYLVVGLGLAGISFCEQMESHNKSFLVFADDSQQASLVAGGLYNPVILKRFTLTWQARQQMQLIDQFYGSLEKKLEVQLDYKIPVLRRFASIEEQNKWFEATDKKDLDYFLSQKIQKNTNPCIEANLGYGEVKYTGRISTRTLLERYATFLIKKEMLKTEKFDYDQLKLKKGYFEYKSIQFKKLVFAEGFGLKNNPFFNYLPLNGTKGELLTIKAPDLKEDNVIKSSVFIIPLGDDLYRVGATYKWKDKTNLPTEASKEELLQKLNTFLKCGYKVVDHVAGIRPTVADRRPLVGAHPKYGNMYVLNGFGSRGVMIAPYASNQLYRAITLGEKLHPEMDVARYQSKFG